MNGFLLDTNVVSEFRKRDRADAGVVEWIGDHAGDELWLSVLVVGELWRGAELIARRDPASGAVLNDWIGSLIDDFGDRILPVTTSIAERWALLNVPDPVPAIDGLIAATALAHDLVLVTRNVDDVVDTGVPLVNPFST